MHYSKHLETKQAKLASPARTRHAWHDFSTQMAVAAKKRQMALSAPFKTCATQNISTQIKMRRRSSIRSLETTPVLILRLRLQLVIRWPPIWHIPTGWGDQEKTDVQEGSNNSKQQQTYVSIGHIFQQYKFGKLKSRYMKKQRADDLISAEVNVMFASPTTSQSIFAAALIRPNIISSSAASSGSSSSSPHPFTPTLCSLRVAARDRTSATCTPA